ncbi:hypothetical protein ACA910_015495 [Epithemia clementina (nom. ined.)]
MPRGKNYVNNDKGVTLVSHKKKSLSMEPCYYGPGCTRKDCIYRHDPNVADAKKTNDPCLTFLAGTCAFTATTCKKRHPPKPEADRLRAKYSQIKCRHGDECRTTSCLYLHPRDEKHKGEPVAFLEHNAFPPLSATNGGDANHNRNGTSADGKPRGTTLLPGSAWKAAPVVGVAPQVPPAISQHQQHQQPPQQLPQQRHQVQHQQHQQHQQHHDMTTPISAQAPAWFPGNPQEESLALQMQQQLLNDPYYPINMYSNGEQQLYAMPDGMNGPPPDFAGVPPVTVHSPSAAMGKKNLNAEAKAWTPGSH